MGGLTKEGFDALISGLCGTGLKICEEPTGLGFNRKGFLSKSTGVTICSLMANVNTGLLNIRSITVSNVM